MPTTGKQDSLQEKDNTSHLSSQRPDSMGQKPSISKKRDYNEDSNTFKPPASSFASIENGDSGRESKMTEKDLLLLHHTATLCGVLASYPGMMVYAVSLISLNSLENKLANFHTHIQIYKLPECNQLYVLGNGAYVNESDILFNIWFCPEILCQSDNLQIIQTVVRSKVEFVIEKWLSPKRSKSSIEQTLLFTSSFPSDNLNSEKYIEQAFTPLPHPQLEFS